MKYIGIAIFYTSFFTLIGAACYITKSAWPLFDLVLTPGYKDTKED